jgi:hypothetical protein
LIFEKLPDGKFLKNNLKKGGCHMERVIILLIGILIGILIARFIFRDKPIGSLRVDQSDPDSGPYLFLELSPGGADEIYKKKYVSLQVDLKDYISQK